MSEDNELIDSLLETIEDFKKKCAKDEQTNADLNTQINSLELQLSSLLEENRLLKSNSLSLANTSTLYSETVRELSTVQMDNQNKREELKFLKAEIFKLNEELANVKNSQNQTLRDLEATKNRLAVVESENNSLLMSLSTVNAAKEKAKIDLTIATDKLYAYERELSNTSEHLDNISAIDMSQKNKIKEVTQQKGRLEIELSLREQMIDDLNKQIIDLNYHLNELTADFNTQIKITKEIEIMWEQERQKNIELSTINSTLESQNERNRGSLTPRQTIYTPRKIPLS